MKLLKIALTGGPCAGKTAALSRIKESFSKLGYKVFIINETATELRSSGITPQELGVYDYQSKQFFLQCTKEDVFGQEAVSSGAEKVLIVCDRGLPDNAAYLTPNEYFFILKEHNMTKLETFARYDAVFMLRSVSNISEKIYRENGNPIRTESAYKAHDLDERILLAWADHPNLVVLDATEDFEEKMKKLLIALAGFCGEDKPFLYNEKYIISLPDFDKIEQATRTEKETYKIGPYSFAVKESTDGEPSFKLVDKNIGYYCNHQEFLHAIGKNEEAYKKKIVSTTYGFPYKNEYIEITTMPHLDKTAVMRVDKKTKEEKTELPDFITVLDKFS